MKVVGFTGPIASGKSTGARMLEQRGYKYFSLSSEILVELADRYPGGQITRTDKQNMGDEMRLRYGDDYWARRTGNVIAEMLQREGGSNIVIDAIFNPAEIVWLRERLGMIAIGVDADEEVRFQRVLRRARESDPTTDPDELRRVLRRDIGIDQPKNGQQTGACLELADTIVENNTDNPKDLEAKLEGVLIALGIEGTQSLPERK